ncbi:hypothetical protein Hanom_Chr11g01008541 [Helianthus anomalus]
MQPWRIYPLCSIVYRSEPYNRFITSETVLVYICHVLGFGTFNDASIEPSKAVRLPVGFDLRWLKPSRFCSKSGLCTSTINHHFI